MSRCLACLCLSIGCGGASTQPSTPAEAEEEPPEVAVSLRLEEVGEREDGAPINEASLVLIHDEGRREQHPLGALAGACRHLPPEGVVAHISCWWAGAGAELKVLRKDDLLHVTRLDAQSDSEPSVVLEVPLPASVRLRPIH